MKKRLLMNLTAALMVSGLVFTFSCAKKQVVSEPPTGVTVDQAAEEEAAAAAARAEELAKQRAMEEARLKAESLKEAQMKEAEVAMKAAAAREFQSQDIYYGFDSSELTPRSKSLLKEKADWIEQNPTVLVTIEGHCDDRGTTEYNLALGERRALSAKKFLVNLGIPESRLRTISYGEERPFDTAATEEAWAKNRRAHFVIK
ncbi:MAG: peptidoglycan-associated lipoprotein Pal [Desulfobacteraceae bacterium]|nr:peptidoglycan-associated lipoprotein Pal [Desulfobacteraceae bacterium]